MCYFLDMSPVDFKVDGESLRFSARSCDLSATFKDVDERLEVSLARQRHSLNKANALSRYKVKPSRPDKHSLRVSKRAHARSLERLVELESSVLGFRDSIRCLEVRREGLVISRLSDRRRENSHLKLNHAVGKILDQSTSEVICPFFVSGECIDQLCTFYHPDR